jgi:LysM repeat protein
MKIRFIPKRKLKAATARRMPRAMEDYGQEPNMSFGRAIVVVVVLHLVAVGGICAFSSIKNRHLAQQIAPAHPARDDASETAAAGDASTKTGDQSAAQEAQPRVSVPPAPVITPVKQPSALQPVNGTAASVKDSGAFYTVAKGDTPVSIARKLHVGYDDLLKLNKITDPKKLKIGQKLRIPARKKSTAQT